MYKTIMMLLLMIIGAVSVKAQEESDFQFNSGVRYSQWVTKSRLNNFYRNKNEDGFAVYDAQGNKTANGKTAFDYVPGLVAKAIVENVQYYSQYQWAEGWTLPFFYSMAGYCNDFYSNAPTSGGSLDNLNATKMFFGIYELTNTGGAYASNSIASTTKSHAQTALGNAMSGFVDHNNKYKISNTTSAYKAGHTIVGGGWYHKSQYKDEMWLDGSYMGPALFAQLRNYNGSDIIGDDWTIAYRQIQALWEMCWNSEDKLLYHAFAAEGHDTYSKTWAGYNPSNGVYHSASYWGRACGWFFLALIDILEQMEKTGLNGTDNYNTLKNHLNELAAGLAARQDEASGCWYQILDEDDTFYANKYNGQSKPAKYNYIESSASALFAAGFMKAIRLGYISSATYETVAKKAYAGLVNNFFATDGKEGVHLFGSCRSAGLGTWSYRDGSKAYYLLGGDVARVAKSEGVTEGKILGAFILAATEYEKLYQDNTVLFEKDLAPEYDLESGDEISCPASGSGSAITYQWYKDGVAVEGATSATIAPLHPGNYYCTATANDRTVKTSVANVTVDGETGVVNSLCSYENETLRYENYNIVGQRVKDAYKGIIVKNRKKILF
ncbi:MAG: glycoside hydrolase family 88 protein [Prevotella sp.]|nr:glycoside hydrolase family 88 protein [Prevotella sp.]